MSDESEEVGEHTQRRQVRWRFERLGSRCEDGVEGIIAALVPVLVRPRRAKSAWSSAVCGAQRVVPSVWCPVCGGAHRDVIVEVRLLLGGGAITFDLAGTVEQCTV
jgi:hypothetical protein